MTDGHDCPVRQEDYTGGTEGSMIQIVQCDRHSQQQHLRLLRQRTRQNDAPLCSPHLHSPVQIRVPPLRAFLPSHFLLCSYGRIGIVHEGVALTPVACNVSRLMV
jgi:hypothetical protein